MRPKIRAIIRFVSHFPPGDGVRMAHKTSILPLRLLRTAAALSFFICGRIGKEGRTAAFHLFPFCGRLNEQ